MKSASNHTNETYLELKYCERCGGLWLRERGSGQMYCGPCWQALEDMPRTTKLDTARVCDGPKWADEVEQCGDDDDFTASGEDIFAAIVPGGVA